MSEVVWISAYRRRKAVRPATYRDTNNAIYEYVMAKEREARQLEDELALSMAHEFEMLEAGLGSE